MRRSQQWHPDMDAKLRTLRGGGMTWDAIAAFMGLSRNTVLERGRKIGARRFIQALPNAVVEARDRPARQAGHPLTWGLINAGTVLEGETYPYPVFL